MVVQAQPPLVQAQPHQLLNELQQQRHQLQQLLQQQQERQAREQLERERQEQERRRLEQERLERERLERERQVQEQLEQELRERERLEQEQRDRERERLEQGLLRRAIKESKRKEKELKLKLKLKQKLPYEKLKRQFRRAQQRIDEEHDRHVERQMTAAAAAASVSATSSTLISTSSASSLHRLLGLSNSTDFDGKSSSVLSGLETYNLNRLIQEIREVISNIERDIDALRKEIVAIKERMSEIDTQSAAVSREIEQEINTLEKNIKVQAQRGKSLVGKMDEIDAQIKLKEAIQKDLLDEVSSDLRVTRQDFIHQFEQKNAEIRDLNEQHLYILQDVDKHRAQHQKLVLKSAIKISEFQALVSIKTREQRVLQEQFEDIIKTLVEKIVNRIEFLISGIKEHALDGSNQEHTPESLYIIFQKSLEKFNFSLAEKPEEVTKNILREKVINCLLNLIKESGDNIEPLGQFLELLKLADLRPSIEELVNIKERLVDIGSFLLESETELARLKQKAMRERHKGDKWLSEQQDMLEEEDKVLLKKLAQIEKERDILLKLIKNIEDCGEDIKQRRPLDLIERKILALPLSPKAPNLHESPKKNKELEEAKTEDIKKISSIRVTINELVRLINGFEEQKDKKEEEKELAQNYFKMKEDLESTKGKKRKALRQILDLLKEFKSLHYDACELDKETYRPGNDFHERANELKEYFQTYSQNYRKWTQDNKYQTQSVMHRLFQEQMDDNTARP